MNMGSRTAVLVVLAGAILAAQAPPAHAGWAPGQFIAKMYTEGLGRIPDQSGWLGMVNYFASGGCTTSNLRNRGTFIYTSAEFTGLGYSNAEKLLALYRGALNREPDAASFQDRLNRLNAGATWQSIVDEVFSLSEFSSKTSAICSKTTPGYGFGSTPVTALIAPGPTGFQGGSSAQLQAQINATAPGGTVWLAQHAVVTVDSMIDLKQGVTLATWGSPSPRQYAKQARLVRTVKFAGPMIYMRANSKLKNIWVTGQRNVVGYQIDARNVDIPGGSGTLVSGNRMENAAGGTNLVAYGTADGVPCSSSTLSSNVVTQYASSHYGNLWSDGFTVACENTAIEDNEIVDATDVAVVLFRSYPAIQRSKVRNNRILNAGNSSYGGLVFDGWKGTYVADFAGAEFSGNLIWSGPYAHYDIALSLGSRPWFGAETAMGVGGAMFNNSSGISKVNVDVGVAVSGMTDAYVQGNTLDITFVNSSPCPGGTRLVASSAGYGSGNIQTPWTDMDVSHCVWH